MTTLRCLQINLRNSRSAGSNLSQILLEHCIDVALIQEPYAIWRDSCAVPQSVPREFSSFHHLNQSHAYGSLILVRKNLSPQPLGALMSNNMACIKVKTKTRTINFISVYCRPSVPISESLAPFDNPTSGFLSNSKLSLSTQMPTAHPGKVPLETAVATPCPTSPRATC